MTLDTHTSKFAILVLALCLAITGPAFAVGHPTMDSSLVTWDAAPGYQLTLTVSGAGQDYRYEFGPDEPASFSLFDTSSFESGGQLVADGNYSWQISASPVLSKDEVAVMREAREAGVNLSNKAVSGYTESGYFTIAGGAFVNQAAVEEVDKSQVFNEDVIVDGSLCVGIDCASNENFGFDTIRLKENNLRIKFDDSSSTGNFPYNDWQLTANDSGNGGANKFSLDDITSGKTPFTVEAGAPNNALYVHSEGRLGINTATPVVDIHAADGNSPTLRLEQNGSEGFTSQTWDISGNETNFFIRDVTGGSKLPFRIEPGAPDNAIYIKSSGNIGFGTNNPASALSVKRSDGTAELLMEEKSVAEETRDMIMLKNNGTVRISLEDTSTDGEEWQFAVNGGSDAFVITNQGSGATEFTLIRADTGGANAGDLTIAGDLFTGAGTCSSGCDAVFRNEVESIEDHAAFMWENSYLRGVGPTVPQGTWNLTEKTGGILNELEKAHIYIEQLNIGLKQRDLEIERLHGGVSELRAELAELKALLAGE